MPLGQSIRIFLADGSVTGIRHAEVVNWTGQAIACPRNRIAELKQWAEAKRPGVYLLFGTTDAADTPAVYIGEAEDVFARLQDHLANKDFWNEIVLFTSKDENLTKAHVRYLESKLIDSARISKRYEVLNSNSSQAPLLPRGDRDAMESFIEQSRIMLGVLGHKVLEPLTASQDNSDTTTAVAIPKTNVGTTLAISTKNIHASAILTDEGIVVLQGSQASLSAAESMSGSYRKIRDDLIQRGILVVADSAYRFSECVVVGYPVNGRDAWKTAEGLSIGQLEQNAVPHIVAGAST